MENLKRTPFFELHKRLGAKFVPFAGWEMPVQFKSILSEAKEVRTGAGLFDISHMGRIFVSGDDSTGFLNYITTNNVEKLKTGEVQYSLIPNDRGGVIDDITVYKLGENEYMLCVNAANREKVLSHMKRLSEGHNVKIEDKSSQLVQIALQGPKSAEIIEQFFPKAPGLKYYTFLTDGRTIVSRTGYTGEDGFEIYIPLKEGLELYKELLKAGTKPAGLGARDVLRIEAGFPLYGHELAENINPLEANLKRFIDFDKDFYGKEDLQRAPVNRKLRGLILKGRQIARRGDKVFLNGEAVGEVSSGTFSPNLNSSIALAFLSLEVELGQTVEVEIRGKRLPAEVVKPRFINNIPKEILKR
jgi:aminomethyltransferase